MSKASQYDRRLFIRTALTAIGSAGLVASRLGPSDPRTRDALSPGQQTDIRPPSGPYAAYGPSNGPSVILLHAGSAGTDADVTRLAERGYRVIVPHGAGAASSDLMALMAALNIEQALVGGLGESARTSEGLAARWPQRLKAMASVNGFGGVTLAATQRPLPPHGELAWWYRYYFIRKGEA